VALRLIYQMFSKLLRWIVLRTRSDATKEIEILVLRLWVPQSGLTSPDLLVRRRRKPGMIDRWRCG
jgi:hypothetical protein